MARALSQEEIDALLAQLATQESAEEEAETLSKPSKKAQLYDFRRPDRLSKEHIRSLHLIHDRFARSYSSSLSAYLRTMSEVNMVSIDQITYSEFLMSLPDPTCFNVLTMDPLEGRAVLEINPSIVFPIIDKLLGGPGQPLAEVREITDIEYKILDGVIKRVLSDLQEAWREVVEVKISLVGMETSPQLIQIVAPNEPVILITFEVKIADISGMMNLCIPSVALEPVSHRFTQDWYSTASKERPPEIKVWIEQILGNVKLNVCAMLGRSTLTVKELLDLEVGDILVLETRPHSPLRVNVAGVPKFEAVIGEHQGNKAVKITSKIIKWPSPPQSASEPKASDAKPPLQEREKNNQA